MIADGLPGVAQRDGSDDGDHTRAPWHFWVLVAATAGYLLWRVIQGFGMLID